MPGIMIFCSLFDSYDANNNYENIFTQLFEKIYKLS